MRGPLHAAPALFLRPASVLAAPRAHDCAKIFPTAGSPQLTGPSHTHRRAQIPASNPLNATGQAGRAGTHATEVATAALASNRLLQAGEERVEFVEDQLPDAARHEGRTMDSGHEEDPIMRREMTAADPDLLRKIDLNHP